MRKKCMKKICISLVAICIANLIGINSYARTPDPFDDEKPSEVVEPDASNDIFLIRTTAYTAPLGKGTASGHPVRYGVVGVNSKYLCSYGGTEWCVAIYSEDGTEFYGYFDCFDCGADAENQTLIDVYFPTLEECQGWMEKTGGKVIVQFIEAEG